MIIVRTSAAVSFIASRATLSDIDVTVRSYEIVVMTHALYSLVHRTVTIGVVLVYDQSLAII